MSYSISISGHGASAEKVKDAFATALVSLAEANAENGGGDPGGTASGSDNAGQSFSFSSTDVLQAARAGEAPDADDGTTTDEGEQS